MQLTAAEFLAALQWHSHVVSSFCNKGLEAGGDLRMLSNIEAHVSRMWSIVQEAKVLTSPPPPPAHPPRGAAFDPAARDVL